MMIHHRPELKLETIHRLVDQEEIHLQQFEVVLVLLKSRPASSM